MRTLLLSLLVSFLFASTCHAALVGQWQPISSPSDPAIRKVAEFAVSAYNAQTAEGLVLVDVASGQQQVVAGTNYRLVLDVKLPSGVAGVFQAAVFESLKGELKLISFVRAGN